MARSSGRWSVLAGLTRRLKRDERGTFAVTLALVLVPLVLTVGVSVDGARMYMAHHHLQDATDSLSLALASSTEQDDTKLRTLADGYLLTNITPATVQDAAISEFKTSAEEIEVTVNGHIDTTFMKLVGFGQMPLEAKALAMRSPTRVVEIALVLDTTYSMVEKESGVAKIDSLKEAASELVLQILPEDPEDTDNDVRVSIVPYSDYVNVGIENKNASWITKPSETRSQQCNTYTTTTDCSTRTPSKTCTRYVDGVPETYECGNQCKTVALNPPKTTCKTVTTTWKGCIGSRIGREYITTDAYPTVKYPSRTNGNSQLCASPIIPLTDNRQKLLTAINGLQASSGGYQPLTYIPGGLIWGVNVLSPTAPYTEAKDYDPANVEPYKILILMTDGENTLRYRENNGEHNAPNGTEAQKAQQLGQTNTDTDAICDYAKSKKIEVFTVAFMVDDATALNLLKNCATNSKKHFDAKNRDRLLSAFSGIARSINQVRLAR